MLPAEPVEPPEGRPRKRRPSESVKGRRDSTLPDFETTTEPSILSRHELPELTATELRIACDLATLASLKGFALSCGCIYILLGTSHLFAVPPPHNVVLSFFAAVSSVLQFTVAFCADKITDRRLAQPAVALCAFIVLFNSVLHIFLTREIHHSTNLCLFMVGCGGLFFSSDWAAAALAFAWAAWVWVVFYSEAAFGEWSAFLLRTFPRLPPAQVPATDISRDPLGGHFVFGLISSTVLSYTIFRSRVLLLASEERIRKQDAIQREKLSEMSKLATQANVAKSQFLRNVSHELRTPIHGILGCTDELLLGNLGADERELAGTVRASGELLLGIVGDLLDFSKLEAGKLEIKPVLFDIRPALRAMVRPFEITSHQAGLNLSLEVEQDVPESVIADRFRLNQIMTNLLGNAVKFTDQGSISLRVSMVGWIPGGHVRLRFCVRDTGIGIPEEKQAEIFHPFTQADGSPTRRHGGSGLGLSISRRLCELMGGTIGLVESKLGIGSEFALELPVDVGMRRFASSDMSDMETLRGDSGSLATVGRSRDLSTMDLSTLSPMILDSGIMTPLSPEWTSGVVRNRKDKSKVAVGNGDYFGLPPAPVQNGGPNAPSPSGLRTLVAEDNKINQQLIQRLLARKGHIVTMCNDGVEALEAFCSSPAAFDAVLSDIQMPRMGGIQLATEIRKKEAEAGSRRVPLLALTAHALERDREACFAAGFDEWLTKPLNQADLFKYLDRLPRRNTGAEKEPRADLKTELKTDPVVGNSQS